MTRRIAITGPESTGKSWLAEHLATHYQTVWVPEYARQYLEEVNRSYVRDDLLQIARGQLNREDTMAEKASGYLFCDTEFLVLKIWSEVKFGTCDPWILKNAEEHRYDLYLLCDIDLPWEFDPLREHPGLRRYLFDLYFKELSDRELPFFIVRGTGRQRLQMAIERIDRFMLNHNLNE